MTVASVDPVAPERVREKSAAGYPHRIASIDGLRAVAILSVILHHYTPWIVVGSGRLSAFVREVAGWAGTGVDLFFVLSGFLITGILLDSKGSSHYFARFYWRRSIRIFPAYYAFLAPLLFFPGLFTGIARPWFILYLRNWRGADPASDGTLGHLWSLAVEEQFYIGWSIVVFLVATRWLPHVTVGLIAVAPVLRAAMGHWGYTGYEIIRVTPARMDSLLLGALVALAVRSSWKSVLTSAARVSLLVAAGGLTIARLLTGPLSIDSRIMQVALPFFSPLLYASILALFLELRGTAAAALTNPFFRVVARYSYAMYLFHLLVGRLTFAVFQGLAFQFPTLSPILAAFFVPTAFAVLLVLTVISWRYIEAPALRLKDRFFGIQETSANSHVRLTRSARIA